MPTPTVFEAHVAFDARVVKQTIPDGGTGDAIQVGPGPCTAKIIPGTSAKLQYSTSLPSLVAAGTANWDDWSDGTVTVPTADIPQGPITGVRGVSVVGICTLEFVQ